MAEQLTERQFSEIEYHIGHARRHRSKKRERVSLDCIQDDSRRYWNAYWSTYDRILGHDLRGKKFLVPGCGFGEDAIRLASLGADVYAFDISPESIDIARARAQLMGVENISFSNFPSERMAYADDFFDFVLFLDILHHVDIGKTTAELRRVLKPGATIIGDELYTHSFVQKYLRENWLVIHIIHPLMTKYIYGDSNPYITEQERKIDENDLAILLTICSDEKLDYFYSMTGRIIPERYTTFTKLDRFLTRLLGRSAKYLAGRVVFEAMAKKA